MLALIHWPKNKEIKKSEDQPTHPPNFWPLRANKQFFLGLINVFYKCAANWAKSIISSVFIWRKFVEVKIQWIVKCHHIYPFHWSAYWHLKFVFNLFDSVVPGNAKHTRVNCKLFLFFTFNLFLFYMWLEFCLLFALSKGVNMVVFVQFMVSNFSNASAYM